MAKTRRYREDLSKTPEWLKKKKLPHRHKFLSGPRILPKGITRNGEGGEAVPRQHRPRLHTPRACARRAAVHRAECWSRT